MEIRLYTGLLELISLDAELQFWNIFCLHPVERRVPHPQGVCVKSQLGSLNSSQITATPGLEFLWTKKGLKPIPSSEYIEPPSMCALPSGLAHTPRPGSALTNVKLSCLPILLLASLIGMQHYWLGNRHLSKR